MWFCTLREGGRKLLCVPLCGVMEIGRQQQGEPNTPCAYSHSAGVTRLVVASLENVRVSRRVVEVRELPDNRVSITNINAVHSLLLSDGETLSPGQSCFRGNAVSFQIESILIALITEPAQESNQEIGSVSALLRDLQHGESSLAVCGLWQRYFHRLEAIARSRLSGSSLRVVDGEDVAIDVFHRLCRGMVDGRFPDLGNRDDLWRLLVVLTRQRVIDEIREHRAEKRGGGHVCGESLFGTTSPGGLEGIFADSPDPAMLASVAEEYQSLLSSLPDDESRLITQLRMEGYSNEEIACSLDLSLRTVERKLARVRELWTCEGKISRQ